MGRISQISKHPQRADIEADILLKRGSNSEIAERYGISHDSVQRWGLDDIAETTKLSVEAAQILNADRLIVALDEKRQRLEDNAKIARALVAEARQNGSFGDQLRALDRDIKATREEVLTIRDLIQTAVAIAEEQRAAEDHELNQGVLAGAIDAGLGAISASDEDKALFVAAARRYMAAHRDAL